MNIKELLLGVPVLFFVIWIFMAPNPQERITRGCEPINWLGNVATSTTALSAETHVGTTSKWSDKLNYSCKYLVWRLFYQADYNKAMGINPSPAATPSQRSDATSGTKEKKEPSSGESK